jgi:hypothetical protein
MFRGSPLESKELRGTTKGLDIPCRGTPGHFRTSDGIVINYVRTVRSRLSSFLPGIFAPKIIQTAHVLSTRILIGKASAVNTVRHCEDLTALRIYTGRP